MQIYNNLYDMLLAYKGPIALPNRYFYEEESFLCFWIALQKYKISSRKLPEQVLESLNHAVYCGTLIGYAVTEWNFIMKDADCKTIRNLLACSEFSKLYPKQTKSKSYDMVRLISLAIQYEDYNYAQHVKEWCTSHIDSNSS